MSTVIIKKGNNYHVKNANGVIEVEFNDAGILYRQTVVDGVAGEKSTVDYCEEIIALSDGKKLKRTRDILTVVE